LVPTPAAAKEIAMTYSTFDYYRTADFDLVRAAHQKLAKTYRAGDIDTVQWYWSGTSSSAPEEYHREQVGPFTLHSGLMRALPPPLVAIYLDSQIKTYMDRDALGDQVRQGIEASRTALQIARETELAKRIGGGSLQSSDVLMVVVEHKGYAVSGILLAPGEKDATVTSIMASSAPGRTSLPALQASCVFQADEPFLEEKETNIVELMKYFRIPDHALKRILPAQLVQKSSYRISVHLSRALTICEAFRATQRWMLQAGRAIATVVCETPNEDVKSLIEGKRLKAIDGREVRIGGIPHRVLTSAAGAELYPAAYKGRSEGTSKIYTLYTFDFGEDILRRGTEYRAQATGAYDALISSGGSLRRSVGS